MAIKMIPPAGTPAFLAEAGWGAAEVLPLAGDASFRRYFRIVDGGRQAVLMDAPPPHEDPRPYIAIAEHLASLGFSAPRILHRNLDQGLVLIEDFGNNRMREAIDVSPKDEEEIYRGVVEVLAELHKQPAMDIADYSSKEYQREAGLFAEWYCAAADIDVDVPGFVAAWDKVLAPVLADQQQNAVTVLRDYHAENIMILDGKGGAARWGLLDFQDALAGHPAYDLVSMLQDARRDVSPDLEAKMLAHYSSVANPRNGFEHAYWVLGAQRNTKILGIFTRLWKRDGKAHYLNFQPRMWGLLERDLARPELAPVKAWFDNNVPMEKRAAFWIHHKAIETA
jgi:N-acetylmuramate 1-kinase